MCANICRRYSQIMCYYKYFISWVIKAKTSSAISIASISKLISTITKKRLNESPQKS